MRNLTGTDKLILKRKRGTSVAWLRRIIVSVGIGGVSYAIMFALMLLSVMYDRAFEPIITLAFDTGRLITNWLNSSWREPIGAKSRSIICAKELI